MAFISDQINDRLFPFLASKGYPLDNLFFRFKQEEHLSLEKKWGIDQGIINLSDKIRADENLRNHVAATYGVELSELPALPESQEDEPPIEEDEDETEEDASGNFTGGPF
jgi:hypothetical protein